MRVRFACLAVVMLLPFSGNAADVHVRPDGNDANPGSPEKPLQTLGAAQQVVRAARAARSPVTVHLHGGVYYLPETLVLTAEDSGTAAAPVTWQAAGDGEVVISGEIKLELKWESFRDGILQAQVPAGVDIDQLFVDGQRQVMARYPDFDPATTGASRYVGAASTRQARTVSCLSVIRMPYAIHFSSTASVRIAVSSI